MSYGETKYADKNMYMTDSDNNVVLEDEISRNKEYRERRLKLAEKFKAQGASEEVVAHEIRLANMLPAELSMYYRQGEIQRAEEATAYREANPLKEEHVKLIYERFDMWLEKYADDAEKLEDELDTDHNFCEPWYWGNIAPGAEEEFYEPILTMDDWTHHNYFSVFEICASRIQERLEYLLNLRV